MTVEGYTLAAIGLLVCIVWCAFSLMAASINSFAPIPDKETNATARKGCAALIAGLAAVAWFVGVLRNGEWGWLG